MKYGEFKKTFQLFAKESALEKLHEQDKQYVWGLRYDILERFPQALSKLVASVEWNNFSQASVVRQKYITHHVVLFVYI